MHHAEFAFVKASALDDGIGLVVRALPDVTDLLHRQRGNTNLEWNPVVGHVSCVTPVKGLRKTVTCPVDWLLNMMVSLPGEVGAKKRVEVLGTNQTSLQHSVDNEMSLSAFCLARKSQAKL